MSSPSAPFKKIIIKGREFRGVTESTLEHDVWMREHLMTAGFESLRMNEGETPEEFVKRGIGALSSQAAMFLLLGGMIVPAHLAPLDWTPQMAEETASFLRSLSANHDKQIVHGLLGALFSGFLMAERTLLRRVQESPTLRAIVNLLRQKRLAQQPTGSTAGSNYMH